MPFERKGNRNEQKECHLVRGGNGASALCDPGAWNGKGSQPRARVYSDCHAHHDENDAGADSDRFRNAAARLDADTHQQTAG